MKKLKPRSFVVGLVSIMILGTGGYLASAGGVGEDVPEPDRYVNADGSVQLKGDAYCKASPENCPTNPTTPPVTQRVPSAIENEFTVGAPVKLSPEDESSFWKSLTAGSCPYTSPEGSIDHSHVPPGVEQASRFATIDETWAPEVRESRKNAMRLQLDFDKSSGQEKQEVPSACKLARTILEEVRSSGRDLLATVSFALAFKPPVVRAPGVLESEAKYERETGQRLFDDDGYRNTTPMLVSRQVVKFRIESGVALLIDDQVVPVPGTPGQDGPGM